MNISFITYLAAAFVVLLEIALVVLLISRKENRTSGLYRAIVCFTVVVLMYCLLYFYFYFQDMIIHDYAIGLPLRIIDYLIDASLFFFWLRVIGRVMKNSTELSKTRVFTWSWIIGILRGVAGVWGAFVMDEYYCFPTSGYSIAFVVIESALAVLSVIVIGYYTIQLIKYDTSSAHRRYAGFVSIVLSLWTLMQQIVDSGLYTGRFISAWAEGIPDTTALTIFIIGLVTFVFVFREDFSPLFYASKTSDDAAESDVQPADPIELAAVQHSLTVRELEVLRLVYEGKNNPEIAEELFISRNTVKKHLQSIYEKVGVNSRMELVYVINLKK